ncbi:GNAT family N-acetyltransferase [Novilysobacter spongiicola]|uniref:N-acetyltransferase domain-containing protein n=1 Tax=Lysobacter spongiicola DSM 21749 TaxID=1122188 RepID=A0A1T4LN40_9GAMM|nr:GNAT family N-acetyltransferase [Lysobacter spongiicola]SJZ56071.1 hypothetical protein SAMN02745674_00078 [Lysobacter spongiicola DSM 21749]
MNQSRVDVEHQPGAGRFRAEVEGTEAELAYRMEEGVMVITHTRVPDAIGGRGVAGALTRAAFDHARAGDIRVRPACSYAEAWAGRHPEYADLVIANG